MARFTQSVSGSEIVVESGSTDDFTWTIQGGTTGAGAVQPTFSGAPLFTGSWYRVGKLLHFSINVDFDNILSFGTGQYYLTLPYPVGHNYLISGGQLFDFSTSHEYALYGHSVAGSDMLTLLTTISNGQLANFTHSSPVNLAVADDFHISGTYSIDPIAL